MARTASGAEHVASGYALLPHARTADQLRLAQAVLLPLELGMSIEQTARAIGRSAGLGRNGRARRVEEDGWPAQDKAMTTTAAARTPAARAGTEHASRPGLITFGSGSDCATGRVAIESASAEAGGWPQVGAPD